MDTSAIRRTVTQTWTVNEDGRRDELQGESPPRFACETCHTGWPEWQVAATYISRCACQNPQGFRDDVATGEQVSVGLEPPAE